MHSNSVNFVSFGVTDWYFAITAQSVIALTTYKIIIIIKHLYSAAELGNTETRVVNYCTSDSNKSSYTTHR